MNQPGFPEEGKTGAEEGVKALLQSGAHIPFGTLLALISARTGLHVQEVRGEWSADGGGRVVMRADGLEHQLTVQDVLRYDRFEEAFALTRGVSLNPPTPEEWRLTAALIIEAARQNLERKGTLIPAGKVLDAVQAYLNEHARGPLPADGDTAFVEALSQRRPVLTLDGRVAFSLSAFLEYAAREFGIHLKEEAAARVLRARGFGKVIFHRREGERRAHRRYIAVPRGFFTPEG